MRALHIAAALACLLAGCTPPPPASYIGGSAASAETAKGVALGNGTAAGAVFVAALNVTYTQPGSTDLTGTIAGITGGAAAAAGFIQPTVDLKYLFNGCVIGAAVCTPFSLLPPSETPPQGPPDLVGPPTLAGLLPFQLLALPIVTPACTSNAPATGEANAPEHACALTDPDVVPPNVSYVDY